jgi:hypothetical protein
MKTFPNTLTVNNKHSFNEMYNTRVVCYLRRDIYEHIINKTENDYFDIERFMTDKRINDPKISSVMVETVMNELRMLGWNCMLAYGKSGLFIYSTKDPPPSCWVGDF